MQKEKLTIQNIKQDIHRDINGCYKNLVLFSCLFIALLSLFFVIPVLNLQMFFYKIFFGFGALLFLVLLIIQIKDLVILYRNLKNKNCIVKDKLISAEIKEEFYGRRYVKTYNLKFSGYGEYIIPEENYNWSSNFSMSAVGVYNYADSGDEFYLVLSKPHTGKILFAYNTKMFELEN